MKGGSFILVFLSFISYGSSQGIIENIVTTLFTDCTEIKNFLGVSYEQLNATNQPSPSDIDVLLYGNSNTNKTVINLPGSGDVLWSHISFNTSLPTEVIFHGFTQNSNYTDINGLISSFITKGGRNVILIDASKIIGYWYMYSSSALKFMGNYVGKELVQLVSHGYDKSMIHLIGFSMGAHVAGFVGKTFITLTGGSLPWITGLDPAGPCFYDSPTADRLDSTDADFVDVIHTNMGVWGTTKEIGDVDFYPNSGNNQPGTLLPAYSHQFAIFLYTESVLNPTNFPSVWCKSWDLFAWGACSWNSRTSMGYGVPKSAYGRHYLYTNGASPYSKGEAGIPAFNFFGWIISLFA